jgi:hypothetical protein
VFTDGRGLAELPFCAGLSTQPVEEDPIGSVETDPTLVG